MKRNSAIDILKIISATGVVFIHASCYKMETLPLVGVSLFANYIFRFAVPFFFICSGYYVTDNKKGLYSVAKLYAIYLLLYKMCSFVYVVNGEVGITSIAWYFEAYLIILILTFSKNKNWNTIIFTSSIMFNIATGHTPIPIDIPFKENGFLTYLWLFQLGQIFKYKKINLYKLERYLLLGCTILMSIANGLILHVDQFYMYNMLLAIILFVSCINMNIKLRINIANISTDIFLFHTFFVGLKIPFSNHYQLFFPIYVSLIIIASLLCGKILRNISINYCEGKLYI